MSGLLAAPLTPRQAHAYEACRSDPIVVLSNGVVLDLGAVIGDDVSDVQQISYVLQVPGYALQAPTSLLVNPTGSWQAKVLSTDGVVGYDEHVTFQAAPPPPKGSTATTSAYKLTALIQTATKNMTVTATIQGGYAPALGITPDQAGLIDWTTAPSGAMPKAPKSVTGPQTLGALPADVTTQWATWAASAPWSVSASVSGLTGQNLVASVSL